MSRDRHPCCECLRDENQSRCRRRFCKSPSGLETNACQTHVFPGAACHQRQKTEDTSTTIPSPDSQTSPTASRRRIGRALERKVVCARTCCEKSPSIPCTYQRTSDDLRLAVWGGPSSRPRYFPGRKPA